MQKASLNEAQQRELSRFLHPDSESAEWINSGDPVTLEIEFGQVRSFGNYLHTDGEWATYPQGYEAHGLGEDRHLVCESCGNEPSAHEPECRNPWR